MATRLDASLPDLRTMGAARVEPSETGMPVSETGAATPRTSTPSGVELARATDEEVMASLQLVLGSPLEAETDIRYPAGGGYEERLRGFKLTEPASPVQIAQARALVAAACEPLDRADLVQELTKLRLAVVSNLRGADLEGWMTVVMEDVGGFPAAVVLEACRRWRRREKFLPAAAELREECHRLNSRRRALSRLFQREGQP